MAMREKKATASCEAAGSRVHSTLPGRDYWSQEIFDLERERIFHSRWVCAGREEQLTRAGDYLTREIVDENILVVRGASGKLAAFYNVCRHRGSRLCEEPQGNAGAAIKCPYHAWAYSHDGRLIGTPNVGEVEGFDRADYPLHPVALDTWEGFIFVNLSAEPAPLPDQINKFAKNFARYRVGELRTGKRLEYDVAANWKIIVENYMECLHCPTVHPELTRLVPLYQKGRVIEDDGSHGNKMIEGATTFSMTGRSSLPPLPGLSEEDKRTYYGFMVFPNLIGNLHSDYAMTYILEAIAPGRTRVISEFLFQESSLAAGDFDPAPMVEFWDRVSRQDWGVCERAQKGVRSRSYKAGVYPPQDSQVHAFNRRYLRERGPER